jgi:alkylhydroperoxidase/carboxymuconolactone decarboxylase family protein YurZ
MPKNPNRIEELKKKYGATAVENAQRLNPRGFPDLLDWRDEMDQHYTKLWLDFTYGGLYTRGVLDERTRHLVVTGQFVVQDETEYLRSHVYSAIEHASPREVLEVMLQATVYVGYPKGARAAHILRQVLFELGRLEEITETQLPLDGTSSKRSKEKERPTWRVPDEQFPEREQMMQKYGWGGISAGLRLQPTHHAQTVRRLDRIDPHFLKHWLDFIYDGMYTRGVLDDKTRVLCMVGMCTVIDEQIQNENHIRAALMLGATPREVLEVTLQSTIYAGMPRSLRAAAILERVLEEQDRTHELTETRLPLPQR